MKAAIYARSSKDKHGVSCESQTHELKTLIASRGDVLVETYTDQELSSTMDYRPAFNEMLGDAKKRKFQILYVYDTSRIGRDVMLVSTVKHKLRKDYNVQIVFSRLPQDSDPTYGTLIERFLEAMDEFHRNVSADGSRRGQQANIRAGYRAGGRAPYGYRLKHEEFGHNRDGKPIKKARLEPDPATASIATEILKRRASGEARRPIIDDLTKRGVLPPNYLRTGKTEWSETTIHSMETNWQIYCGHLVYGLNGDRRFITKEVVQKNTHPALIDETEGMIIAARLRNKKMKDASKKNRGYPLSQILYCAECGERMHGDRGIYVCPRAKKKQCDNQGIGQNRIEAYLYDILTNYVLPDYDPQKVFDAWQKEVHDGLPEQARIDAMDKELATVKNQIANLTEAIAKTGGHEIMLRKLDELKAREINLYLDRENLKLERMDVVGVEDAVKKMMADFKEAAKRSDLASRRQVFHTFFDRVEIGKKEGAKQQRKIVMNTLFRLPDSVFSTTPNGFVEYRVIYKGLLSKNKRTVTAIKAKVGRRFINTKR